MDRLKAFLEKHRKDKTAVAYSGGVDSSLIAFYARDFSDAVFVKTEFTPGRMLDQAREFAEKHGLRFKTIELRVLGKLEDNPENRCYLCKDMMYSKIEEEGYETIFDGTNKDDLSEDRPGLKANEKHGVISALAQLSMGKDEVRGLMEKIDARQARKASETCLATRIAAGSRISEERLARIDSAEDILREMGFCRVKVRDHGNLARIQLGDQEKGMGQRKKIGKALKGLGYEYITIDLDDLR